MTSHAVVWREGWLATDWLRRSPPIPLAWKPSITLLDLTFCRFVRRSAVALPDPATGDGTQEGGNATAEIKRESITI